MCIRDRAYRGGLLFASATHFAVCVLIVCLWTFLNSVNLLTSVLNQVALVWASCVDGAFLIFILERILEHGLAVNESYSEQIEAFNSFKRILNKFYLLDQILMKTEDRQLKYGMVNSINVERPGEVKDGVKEVYDLVLVKGVQTVKGLVEKSLIKDPRKYLSDLREVIDSMIQQIQDDKERKGAKFLGFITVDENLLKSMVVGIGSVAIALLQNVFTQNLLLHHLRNEETYVDLFILFAVASKHPCIPFKDMLITVDQLHTVCIS
eukprot:TRINITY_DN5579_c0_g2_i2.p1 TRINITY_DN5579_c0_g2~~TRINITY_DN5579_c0_g2_i2.p1  ORF type:complete len:301 (+),score=76.05 TRINITY_DN5579_c0_g2_i2:110-904(+)